MPTLRCPRGPSRSALLTLSLLAASCTSAERHVDAGDATTDGSGEFDDAGDSGPDADASSGCSVDHYDGVRGVAMYVMFDRSSSMGDSVGDETKWEAMTAALSEFVEDGSYADVGVGLQYFGLPNAGGACTTVTCSNDGDCGPSACGPCALAGFPIGICSGFGTDSCDSADYATAEVAIGPAAEVGQSVRTSLASNEPGGGSPLSAPLEGALDHARSWASAHADVDAVVVLITDSEPGACDTDVGNIADLAAAGRAGSPSTSTYLVTIGTGLESLDAIAVAGGTTRYDLASDATLGSTAHDALQDVADRARSWSCRYPLSAGAEAAGQIAVHYRTSTEAPLVEVAEVSAPEDCGSDDGYFVDVAGDLRLCPATCVAARSSAGTIVTTTYGCQSP